MTYTGQKTTECAGGIVLGGVQLNVSGLFLSHLAGSVKLASGLVAQLMCPALRVIDYRVGGVKIGAGLERSCAIVLGLE